MIKLIRIGITLSILFSLLLSSIPTFAASPENKGNFVPDHILVKFKAGITATAVQNTHKRHGGTVLKEIPHVGVQIVKVAQGTVQQEIQAYRMESIVQYAEPDYIIKADGSPNDPGFSQQWGLTKIQAPQAWETTNDTSSVKIAILDTGIDQDHEDLAAKIVANQNFSTSSTVDDLYGHGTHVAGIAAAIINNGKGIAGTACNASLMNVKVMDDTGTGTDSSLANGIIWAADNGAKVINMSLKGGSALASSEAVAYAWNKGVVLVAAAGNNGNDSLTFPADYPNCLSVAATDQNDVKASFSTYGSWVDVAAPGVGIYSTLPNHTNAIGSLNYGYLDGTSMAAPFVSGLAALVWTTPLGTSNSAVVSQIENSADPINGTDTNWIFGRINASKAVRTDLPRVNTNSAMIIPPSSATLYGELTKVGTSTPVQISFDYGTSPSFGNSTPPQYMSGIGNFSATITGLDPSATYYYRAKVKGSDTTYGVSNSFITPPYFIVPNASTGGSISPSNTVKINYGDNQTFNFTAKSNFHVSNIIVDGVSVGVANSYTFSNVTASHSISVCFASNEVLGWGANNFGQLGNGVATDTPNPIPSEVSDLSEMIEISSGAYHNLALKSDGTVWAWGDNVSGELGDGTLVDHYTPIQVKRLNGIIGISAGSNHNLVLKSDGTMWAWGDNTFGQLGDGTTIERNTPVQITGLSGITSICAGYWSSLALKSDGTVWAWGSNNHGQLGDGTTTNRYYPIQVTGLNGIIAISAGVCYNLVHKQVRY